jgi:hypothetical protein
MSVILEDSYFYIFKSFEFDDTWHIFNKEADCVVGGISEVRGRYKTDATIYKGKKMVRSEKGYRSHVDFGTHDTPSQAIAALWDGRHKLKVQE